MRKKHKKSKFAVDCPNCGADVTYNKLGYQQFYS